jgi:hypothetical protein
MSASSSARPQCMLHVLKSIRTPLLLLLLLTLSGGSTYAQVPDPISGVDDTPKTQWRATTANNAGFGVANVTESSQPYTHTTDGQFQRTIDSQAKLSKRSAGTHPSQCRGRTASRGRHNWWSGWCLVARAP